MEKHRAWAKKHRAERQVEFRVKGEDKVKAKKALGQNFLKDENVAESIVKSTEIAGKIILEVGAGQGFLTKHILSQNPKKLIIVEKDGRMIPILQGFCEANGYKNVEIINGDALQFDIAELSKKYGEKITIIANLPYNIGTTLVVNWMEKVENINEIVVMLQKEVVDRICAKTNTKDYGRVSVLVQSLCDVAVVVDVPPTCFDPQPKVMSAVVKITPKTKEIITQEQYQKLDDFCKIAFSQRRKKLANVLKNSKYKTLLLPDFIDENARAEDLSVEDYIKIISCFSSCK